MIRWAAYNKRNRIAIPCIDIDFDFEERERVVQWVMEK